MPVERKHMGCVTDMFWKLALMALYPNRKANHPDSFKRMQIAHEHRDIPELASAQVSKEARRIYSDEVQLADLNHPRWQQARGNR